MRKGAPVPTNSPEETSERKRISIPKADESVLKWWESQHDVGLSVRMLIRNEIERSGYVDVAFQPVTQLPRRGRRSGSDESDDTEPGTPVAQLAYPAEGSPAPALAQPAAQPAAVPQPQPVAAGSMSPIDVLMNG